MFESYSGNKYVSTGVIQWMLNNAWPSMIWHLYDYYLDTGAGYYAVKKACEPIHIQYSYDSSSIEVVNSTYRPVSGLHASIVVHGIGWNQLYSSTADVSLSADSSQRVFKLPSISVSSEESIGALDEQGTAQPVNLYSGMERIFLIDLKLTDSTGKVVSRNFYWVPYTLTSFDWNATNYTHTPSERYPDLRAMTQLPPATVTAQAEVASTPQGREIRLHLKNTSGALAFQVRALARTPSGDLIAPVIWSDDWIELTPGESRTLTAVLPKDAPANAVVKLAGWNVQATTLTPVPAAGGAANGQ